MKTIVLENVGENHLTLLRELAKTLRFSIKSVSESAYTDELNQRIENIENGSANLITPDWGSIVEKSNAIQ